MRALLLFLAISLTLPASLSAEYQVGTNPKDAEHFAGRAYAASRMGSRTLAISLYKKAISASPTFHEALYNLACEYAKGGETELAVSALQQAIELKSHYRMMAQTDVDFTPISQEPAFKDTVGL